MFAHGRFMCGHEPALLNTHRRLPSASLELRTQCYIRLTSCLWRSTNAPTPKGCTLLIHRGSRLRWHWYQERSHHDPHYSWKASLGPQPDITLTEVWPTYFWPVNFHSEKLYLSRIVYASTYVENGSSFVGWNSTYWYYYLHYVTESVT